MRVKVEVLVAYEKIFSRKKINKIKKVYDIYYKTNIHIRLAQNLNYENFHFYYYV